VQVGSRLPPEAKTKTIRILIGIKSHAYCRCRTFYYVHRSSRPCARSKFLYTHACMARYATNRAELKRIGTPFTRPSVWPRCFCFCQRAPAEDISSFRLLREIARAHKLYFTPSDHKTATFLHHQRARSSAVKKIRILVIMISNN